MKEEKESQFRYFFLLIFPLPLHPFLPLPNLFLVSCAKNHDIKRRRAVVKLPRARDKEREEDTVCSLVHIIFSRDVISEIHTRDTQVSYVTLVVN